MPKLLDIGCANGAFLVKARERGFDPVGVETNVEVSLYAKQNHGLEIINRPVELCCFEEEMFDIITLHDVLEHMTDPALALKRIRQWIKPNGLLVVDIPNGDEFSLDWHHTKPREHLWYFRLRDLKALLKRAGFWVAKIDYPISGKLVTYCKPVKKLKIAGPGRIGDIQD